MYIFGQGEATLPHAVSSQWGDIHQVQYLYCTHHNVLAILPQPPGTVPIYTALTILYAPHCTHHTTTSTSVLSSRQAALLHYKQSNPHRSRYYGYYYCTHYALYSLYCTHRTALSPYCTHYTMQLRVPPYCTHRTALTILHSPHTAASCPPSGYTAYSPGPSSPAASSPISTHLCGSRHLPPPRM
jgi:hypothetical protein